MNSLVKWVLRLAVIAAAAWFLRPLYLEPPIAQPRARNKDDYVRWTYHDIPDEFVLQRITVYGDGRNVVELHRQIGDPDIPDTFTKWKVRRDKVTGVTIFTREQLLTPERAKKLLDDAVHGGMLDLRSIETTSAEQLEIESHFDDRTVNARGPQQLSSAFDWKADRWHQRKLWQRVAPLPSRLSEISPYLEKRDFILVDDYGKPIAKEDEQPKQ